MCYLHDYHIGVGYIEARLVFLDEESKSTLLPVGYKLELSCHPKVRLPTIRDLAQELYDLFF